MFPTNKNIDTYNTLKISVLGSTCFLKGCLYTVCRFVASPNN